MEWIAIAHPPPNACYIASYRKKNNSSMIKNSWTKYYVKNTVNKKKNECEATKELRLALLEHFIFSDRGRNLYFNVLKPVM